MKTFENGNEILQAMLDQRGLVEVRDQGVYLLNRALTIHSHTRLLLSPGVIIKAVAMSRCSLIENAAFYGDGRDEDIEIVGGVWDGNCDEQGYEGESYTLNRNQHGPYDPRRFTGKQLRFAHIERITLRDLTVKDPVGYGIQIGDVKNYTVRDIHFDYNCHFGCTDGVHINGPACDGVIERMHGVTNDDMVSLTTGDEDHAEVSRGPIARCLIDGVHAENAYSGVRILSSGDPLTDVTIRNVSGTFRVDPICVTHHNVHPGEPIWMDRIVIDGVTATKSDRVLPNGCCKLWSSTALHNRHGIVWIAKGLRIGEMVIRNVRREEKTATTVDTIKIDSDVEISRLKVENITHTFACGQQMPLINNEGKVTELLMDDERG